MNAKPMRVFFLAAYLLVLSSSVGAELFDRGNGLIYSSTIGVTFTQNANLAGLMDFATASAWVASLELAGVTGWRLPTPTANTTNELARLFYEEFDGSGGQAYYETPNTAAWGMFTDIQDWYWYNYSQVAGVPVTTHSATFSFNPGGGVELDPVEALNYVWAVRDGDVSTVPIPASIWLFVSGILGLGTLGRKNARAQ